MGTLTINNSACNIVIYSVNYGLLYNWYAATDSRKISSSDNWIVPTKSQYDALNTYINDPGNEGLYLKEPGTDRWEPQTTEPTNSLGMTLVGGGFRQSSGSFNNLKGSGVYGTSSAYLTTDWYSRTASANADYFSSSNNKIRYGYSLRLLKTSTSLTHGQSGMYTGNDGKTYRTICIGTQEWLADNLSETRFRDGSIIQWYGANPANYFTLAEWGALTSAACCAYANDVNNVAPGFSFPT